MELLISELKLNYFLNSDEILYIASIYVFANIDFQKTSQPQHMLPSHTG